MRWLHASTYCEHIKRRHQSDTERHRGNGTPQRISSKFSWKVWHSIINFHHLSVAPRHATRTLASFSHSFPFQCDPFWHLRVCIALIWWQAHTWLFILLDQETIFAHTISCIVPKHKPRTLHSIQMGMFLSLAFVCVCVWQAPRLNVLFSCGFSFAAENARFLFDCQCYCFRSKSTCIVNGISVKIPTTTAHFVHRMARIATKQREPRFHQHRWIRWY